MLLGLLGFVHFVKHFGQHQACLRGGLGLQAGFEVALGFAPQLFGVGHLAEVQQQGGVLRGVVQPAFHGIHDFLLFARAEVSGGFNHGRQELGVAVFGIVGFHPFHHAGILADLQHFFGNRGAEFAFLHFFGNAAEAGFERGIVGGEGEELAPGPLAVLGGFGGVEGGSFFQLGDAVEHF